METVKTAPAVNNLIESHLALGQYLMTHGLHVDDLSESEQEQLRAARINLCASVGLTSNELSLLLLIRKWNMFSEVHTYALLHREHLENCMVTPYKKNCFEYENNQAEGAPAHEAV